MLWVTLTMRDGIGVLVLHGERTAAVHCVRTLEPLHRKGFVPLTCRPGDLAEVDFFEGLVEIDGKVRGVYTVAPSGDEYHGTSFAEVVDSGGIVLYAVSVTNDGRRIRVELP